MNELPSKSPQIPIDRLMAAAEAAATGMTSLRGSSRQDIKSNQAISAAWNRRLVVAVLSRRQPLSRRQIAQMTGLRDSALTYIIRELLLKGIVRNSGKQGSDSVGPKHNLLSVNDELGYVIGVSLARGVARIVTRSIAGNLIDSRQIPCVTTRLEDVPGILREDHERWLGSGARPTGALLAMGVGVPGIVDPMLGRVTFSRMFRAMNVPLAAKLEEVFKTQVVIDHDANLGCIADARKGNAVGLTNFIYVLLNADYENPRKPKMAYGAALYVNRELFRGFNYAAGELEDMLTPAEPPIRTAADLELLRLADAALPSHLLTWIGDFAQHLARIINFIDPAGLIIGGNIPIKNRTFFERLHTELTPLLIPLPADRRLTFSASAFGEDAVAQGAAIVAGDHALLAGGLF